MSGRASLERRPHGFAVAHRSYAVAVLFEVVAQETADVEIVVDDEHVVLGTHGSGHGRMAMGSLYSRACRPG